MSNDGGYNPMRWNCEQSGCFNIKMRPKIEIFHKCFPEKINFGDVDGIVEQNGYALMLEWKSLTIDLQQSQSIMYKRLTKGGKFTVVVLCGCAEKMEINYMAWVSNGVIPKDETVFMRRASLDDAMRAIKGWSEWVSAGAVGHYLPEDYMA